MVSHFTASSLISLLSHLQHSSLVPRFRLTISFLNFLVRAGFQESGSSGSLMKS